MSILGNGHVALCVCVGGGGGGSRTPLTIITNVLLEETIISVPYVGWKAGPCRR